MKTFTMQ